MYWRVEMRFYGGLWIACALAATVTLTVAQEESLTGPGHSVVRLTPKTEDQLRHVRQLLDKFKTVDVWRHPSTVNNPVDIRLSPFIRNDVIGGMEEAGVPVTTLIEDVQAVVDEQAAARQQAKSRTKSSDFQYFHYHTMDEIYAWMKNITTFYKDLKAELFNVTDSYEGRPLTGIHIATQPQKRLNRPVFFFEGGIHAREWISPATVIYMVGKMLDLYGLDPELTATVDKFEWYILPVTNPDGYVYTWQGNTTRLWRKTRSKQEGTNCTGVDPNRNWDVHWCETGASKDPCQDTYCGPSAFSEVEVKGVADFIMNLGNVKAFIDFHSYSQLWMSPYGYTKDLPKDYEVQDKGSIDAINALTRLYQTEYKHGSIANAINYISSGSSADWTYTKAKIIYSYGVELRDTGEFGFILPDAQIVPSGLETLAALKALADYVAAN